MIAAIDEDVEVGATNRRLTDEERALAEEWWPDALRLAKGYASRYAHHPDVDSHDIAVRGLWKAIGTNGARTTPKPFEADLRISVYCAAIDELRQATKRGKDRNHHVPFSVFACEDAGWFTDAIVSDEPPVDEALSAIDEVVKLSHRLTPKRAQALRLYYLDASCSLMRQVGQRMGVGETRVSQYITQAHAELRRQLEQAS